MARPSRRITASRTQTARPDTAAIYCRISLDRSNEQAGVQRQLKECKELCARLGFNVGEIYIDNDISATSGKIRPEFERLLADRPPLIVVWHTDRLVRVTRDLERVIALEVSVHAVTAGQLDLSSPSGRAVARTITAWATYEGEQKALRQIAAHRQRTEDGRPFWSRRPFGFERNGSHNERESHRLRLLYFGLLEGKNLSQMCRELNADGYSTTVNNPWRQPTLRQTLRHPRNAGIMTYYGEEVGRAAWQPIVPLEVFTEAAALLDLPERNVGGVKRGPKASNLLTGIARCGECGGDAGGRIAVGYQNQRHIKQHYPYYMCRDNHCCTHKRVDTDGYVIERVIAYLAMPENADIWTKPDENDKTIGIRQEAQKLNLRLNELSTDFADGLIDRQQLQAGSARIRDRLASIDQQLKSVGRVRALDGLPAGATEIAVRLWWDGLDFDQQRMILQTLTKAIRLHRRGKGTRTFVEEKIVIQWREGRVDRPTTDMEAC